MLLAPVRHVHIAMAIKGESARIVHTRTRENAQVRAGRGEFLDRVIAPICHVPVAAAIEGKALRLAQTGGGK